MNFSRKDFNCAKDYREALEDHIEQIEYRQAVIGGWTEEISSLKEKIKQLEEELSTYSKIEVSFDADNQKLLEENNSLKEQIRQLQESITRYTNTIDTLSEELDRLRGRMSGCEDENYHLRIKIEELKINQRKR